ncbi:MAG: outer membrane protein adhesin transport system [Bradyrhizobium sp.]|nr:outer membrane protein adhesin transport system [Bradyrhizobium sp.]
MGRVLQVLVVLLISGAGLKAAWSAEPFSILDAINQAVKTNPGVGEAAANRRATEAELHQSQGALLPQIRLDASAGPEMLNQHITPPPVNNGTYLNGREVSVTIRQTLFDGLSSINEIWRQAARVDAAAFRVLERTELIALDAAEAYVDVTRYTRIVALAEQNLQVHMDLRKNVRARFAGGRAGEGDTQQAEERVAAAEAALADFRLSLDNARAKYRKTVGLEPYNMRFPGRLPDMPSTKNESLDIAFKYNPTIRAAGADVIAAKRAFDETTGAFVPNVSLEGRALRGVDSILYPGLHDEASGKVVVSWDIFRGGQDSWKRAEAGQRMIEEQQKHARLQREALESLDKAWAARTITTDRAAALLRDVEAARRTFIAYNKEYELGQRTLIDLLNSQNQYFNANVSLVSARGVAVFADYQLLAAMGQLLTYLKTGKPPETDQLETGPLGLAALKLAPILLRAPEPGSEPLNTVAPVERWVSPFTPVPEPQVVTFGDRWSSNDPSDANALFLASGKFGQASASAEPVAVKSY